MDLLAGVIEQGVVEQGFVENAYGSKLQLHVEGDAVRGRYSPPPSKSSSGEAVFEGTVFERFVIRGQWTHVQGPLTNGSFEMKLDGSGNLTGWWAQGSKDLEAARPQQRTAWVWANEALADLQDPQGSTLLLRRERDASVTHERSWLIRFRRFCSSVHLERFTMFASWLFFAQTALQLVSSIWAPTMFNAELNLFFNVIYSSLYGLFLAVYACSEKPPSAAYIAGVALYFFGYVAFVVLYSLDVLELPSIPECYTEGTCCFLIGSLLLTMATRGPETPALFWGSVSFLSGSVLFAMDALQHVPGLVPGGLALFVAGRLFFVHGSQTPRCDIFFRDTLTHVQEATEPLLRAEV